MVDERDRTIRAGLPKANGNGAAHDHSKPDEHSIGAEHGHMGKSCDLACAVTFSIPGRLPSLNEIIQADRNPWRSKYGNRVYRGSIIRASAIRSICTSILVARVHRFDCAVSIHIRYVERDRRRDPDNVFSGAKFILDALVKAGILGDDSQQWVRGCTSDLGEPEKGDSRIEVSITPYPGAELPRPRRLPARDGGNRKKNQVRRNNDISKWSYRTL